MKTKINVFKVNVMHKVVFFIMLHSIKLCAASDYHCAQEIQQ